MPVFEQTHGIVRRVIPFGLVLILFSWLLPYWGSVDQKYNDYWRTYIASSGNPDPDILIVEIDDQSLTAMEPLIGRWPWPRSVHGFMLEGIIPAQPQAVIFDILFSEADIYRPDDDAFFIEIAKNQNNVVFSSVLVTDAVPIPSVTNTDLPPSLVNNATGEDLIKLILPEVVMPGSNPIGLINFLSDADGVARDYPVTTIAKNTELNSIPAVVVNTVLGNPSRVSGTIGLKYQGTNSVPYQSIAYSDVWQLVQSSNTELFQNKIIIIGATATGLHDLVESPFAKSFPATSVLATAIDNLLNNDYLTHISDIYAMMILAVLLALIYLIINQLSSYRQRLTYLLIGLLLLAVILYGISYLLIADNILFPGMSVFALNVIAVCFCLITLGVEEYLNRQHATNTFSRFMDPTVVESLVSNEDWQSLLDYKSQDITILFSDIRGFTTLSESRTPEEVMRLLNRYFNLQVEAIFKEQGTLDKFIGDAIMAFWGAPVATSDHAERAIRCALAMIDGLEKFKSELPPALQNFDIGIGIHTGKAVVGMLGSEKRFDYTAIGDAVNLSSRIEGVTKGKSRLLVSEDTMTLCSDKFDFYPCGEFNVKGRQQAVRLYALSPVNDSDT